MYIGLTNSMPIVYKTSEAYLISVICFEDIAE